MARHGNLSKNKFTTTDIMCSYYGMGDSPCTMYMINPLVQRGKIKIRQFNFELTFNGFICNLHGLSQCSL